MLFEAVGDEFEEMTFDVVLFPAMGLEAAMKALQNVDGAVAELGIQQDTMNDLVTWQGRDVITDLNEVVELEKPYATE